ncbi:hypothetical protein PR048_009004 [Dryococelus australis]|uniref:DDE Tnp4 domain-containing protein n=1 Tax=Dryococelus australis TaxID=614101 RepID=A0ABQ9HYN9_9NEOP|nr:hypothetical protein PR048_009004 [Dryococelus australis]
MKSFDELACKVSDRIRRTQCKLLFFCELGTGCYLIDLHYSYRINHTTLCKITKKACREIWSTMLEKKKSEGFQKRSNVSNCIGSIDSKHVSIVKPPRIADSDYKFVYVNVGSFGKDSDSTVLEQSDFFLYWDMVIWIPHKMHHFLGLKVRICLCASR